jgi:S1-C subfamily serine protease
MTEALVALSDSISRVAAAAAPLLSAIRIGPNQHITGLVSEGGVVVTVDQGLPALDRYTVVLPRGRVAACRQGPRDPGANLATLLLETAWPVVSPDIATAEVGCVAVVVGADADASPTVRLTVVRRMLRTADGLAPVLDTAGRDVDPGCLVLDARGRLIGLASICANGEVAAIPAAVVRQMLMPSLSVSQSQSAPVPSADRRGWLGVALQPIIVPDSLAARTGQASGRMVVSISKGGPAEKAGLRIGDVLLALNGTSASGPHALRAFLGSERIGSNVEVRLLRDGGLMAVNLTIAPQPG